MFTVYILKYTNVYNEIVFHNYTNIYSVYPQLYQRVQCSSYPPIKFQFPAGIHYICW